MQRSGRRVLVAAVAVAVAAGGVSVAPQAAQAETPAAVADHRWATSTADTAWSPVMWAAPAAARREPAGGNPSSAAWTPTATRTAAQRLADPGGSKGLVASTAQSTTPGLGSASADGLGLLGTYGLEKFSLSDNATAQVNLANGNLVLHTSELGINGPGLSFNIDRFYNSRSVGAGAFGSKGVMSIGRDVGLAISATSVTFYGPSGFAKTFTANGSSWTMPAGINADLVKLGNGQFTLTYRASREKLTFSAAGYLLSDADRNGLTQTFAYNANNTLASGTDTAGRVTTFGYDTTGRVTSWTDPAARTGIYTYNAAGQLATAQDTAGKITTYTYDTSGRLTRVRTPQSRDTDVVYDTAGRVASVTRRFSTTETGTTSFAYAAGATTETDPNGGTVVYALDAAGKVLSVTDQLNHRRAQTWTANDDVATAADAMGVGAGAGNTTTYSYDTANNQVKVASPLGAARTAQYAATAGCVTSDTTHPYQAKCSTDDAGNQVSLTYDGPGNTVKTQDTTPGNIGGNITTYTYQGIGGVTCAGKAGQQCTSTDALGRVTTNLYDSDGNLIKVTPPAPLGATTISYDSIGRVMTVTDGNGDLSTVSYDARDRTTQTLAAGALSCTSSVLAAGNCTKYAYDDDGNQLNQAGQTGTTIRAYDLASREKSMQQPGFATIASGYDKVGNLTSYVDPGGTVYYRYNADNSLLSVAEPNTGSCLATPTTLCTTFTYDNNAMRTAATFPSGVTQRWAYDRSSRLIRTYAGPVGNNNGYLDYRYGYGYNGSTATVDDRALIVSRTDAIGNGAPAGSVIRYGYDTLNRLTGANEYPNATATTPTTAWAYAYDKVGNRTSATASGVTTTYGYNAADQLTSRNGSTAGWSYDGAGNETAGLGGPGAPARTASTYTAYSQVDAVTIGGVATTYRYADNTNDRRVSQQTGSGPLTKYNIGSLGASTESTGTAGPKYLVRTPDGQPLSLRTSTSRDYYLTDQQGSVVGLVGETGAKTGTFSYDPYGLVRVATGTAAATNPYRYAGGYLDTATGLYKLGHRYYDPTLGRFTQPDPSGQEANRYLYAQDNPTNFTDASGLFVAVPENYEALFVGFDYCTKSPDGWGKATFKGPCAVHDICYDGPDGSGATNSAKACDDQFYEDLKENCSSAFDEVYDIPGKLQCWDVAAGYYAVVIGDPGH